MTAIPRDGRFRVAGPWIALAAFGAALAWVAFALHPIGGSATETDFYGFYADGARALQHGAFDPRRYGVVGPVYEAALALVGCVVPDLFRAAQLISVLGTCATVALWWALVQRRAGVESAAWSALLIAANATVALYGHSVTTDALAMALQAGTLLALLGFAAPRAALAAGVLAALATLTRYSAVYLPLGALVLACVPRVRSAVATRAGKALFAAGFLALTVPWTIVAVRAGAPPGGALFHNVAFDVYAHGEGATWDEYAARLQPQFQSLGDVLARDPGAVVRRELSNLADHVRRDGIELLGFLPAFAVVLAAGVALWTRSAGGLGAVWFLGALQLLALVPVFYSTRYMLPLVPFYATVAGSLILARDRLPAWRGAAFLTLVIALVASWTTSIQTQQRALGGLPREVLPAARALRGAAAPGDRVMARKPHLAWHAGLSPAAFPLTDDLATLGREAREGGVGWLYFSEVEAGARPALWYLADTAARVPGLAPAYVAGGPRVVLYRVGPEFGAEPAWMRDETARAALVGRVPPRERRMWESRTRLMRARAAQHDGRYEEALADATAATEAFPHAVEPWLAQGDAYLALGRLGPAQAAFTRALQIDMRRPEPRLGLGWVMFRAGERGVAADAWRPVVEVADRPTLVAMAALFDSLGERATSARVRRAIERSRP